MMDINKIFNLFSKTDIDTPLDEKFKAANELMNFQETPVFWIGMFKKIILNNKVIYEQLYKSLPSEVVNQLPHFDDMAEVVTYSRAWFYISKLDTNRPLDIDALKIFVDDDLIVCCKLAIHYFEEKEEYEKCAHIKKIQDKIEFLLT